MKANVPAATLHLMLTVWLASVTGAFAQTTAFNYQGLLSDGGSPANGGFQLQFKLFDAETGGNRIGADLTDVPVTATNGTFGTRLDFGASPFAGADRFLEIAVRRNAEESYTTLSPRQQIRSSPYSIRTLSAAQADTAMDSVKLGGVAASEYLTATGVGNAFVRNTTEQQVVTSFNIDGSGFLGGMLQANVITARTGTGFYGLKHTDGTTTVGTYVGGSASGASGAWFGTETNHPLHFFTNNGQPVMTLDTLGRVGVGTASPQAKLHVAGDAVQDRDRGGFAKALLYVRGDGTPVRCYNGVTGSSAGGCGFAVTRSGDGLYQVDFGFSVTDRFISVTTGSNAFINNLNTGAQVGYDVRLPDTALKVRTFVTNSAQAHTDSDFFITVF